MNDFSELERELKQLRPAAVATELPVRIEQALANAAAATPTAGILPRRPVRWSWFALGLGAAAAAAFFLLARLDTEMAAPQSSQNFAAAPAPSRAAVPAEVPRTFVPDGMTRVVYNTRDEGLVYPENAAEPVRRVRSRSRETLQWKDPSTGASLRVSYPTEEVQLIPISGQ